MLYLVTSAIYTTLSCKPYCNAYTHTLSSCAGCSITAEVNGGRYCSEWCNDYTCGSIYCQGCTFWPCDKCAFQGSFAYKPKLIPPGLLDIMKHDKSIIQPNGCNVCPEPGVQPAWIAPGDMCSLASEGFSTAQFDHCNSQYANDYEPSHHVKACLSMQERNHLWLTGHCHGSNSTLPYVGKEGLLFCVSGA